MLSAGYVLLPPYAAAEREIENVNEDWVLPAIKAWHGYWSEGFKTDGNYEIFTRAKGSGDWPFVDMCARITNEGAAAWVLRRSTQSNLTTYERIMRWVQRDKDCKRL